MNSPYRSSAKSVEIPEKPSLKARIQCFLVGHMWRFFAPEKKYKTAAKRQEKCTCVCPRCGKVIKSENQSIREIADTMADREAINWLYALEHSNPELSVSREKTHKYGPKQIQIPGTNFICFMPR